MAMLTNRAYKALLQKIWETGGLTKDMEDSLEKLKADFDEREGILRKYGEVYDGEDKDSYDWKERESVGGEWETKYNEMKKRYIERFLGTSETTNTDGVQDTVDVVTDENDTTDNTTVTIDELLRKE